MKSIWHGPYCISKEILSLLQITGELSIFGDLKRLIAFDEPETNELLCINLYLLWHFLHIISNMLRKTLNLQYHLVKIL